MEMSAEHMNEPEIDRVALAGNRKRYKFLRQWIQRLSTLTMQNSRIEDEDVQDFAARVRKSSINHRSCSALIFT